MAWEKYAFQHPCVALFASNLHAQEEEHPDSESSFPRFQVHEDDAHDIEEVAVLRDELLGNLTFRAGRILEDFGSPSWMQFLTKTLLLAKLPQLGSRVDGGLGGRIRNPRCATTS